MTNDMTCPTCGTRYTIPASGSVLCPNNNCPRHTSIGVAAQTGPLRQRIAAATQEAEMWDLAVQRAEDALAAARDNQAAARARIADVVTEAQAQAEAELAAIKGLASGPKLVKKASP